MTIPNQPVIDNEEILNSLRIFFKENIVKNHITNIIKLNNTKEFKINPFIYKYLAAVVDGEVTPRSIAKALIYPRALGASITTSFGQNMQKLTSDKLPGLASTTEGIDIEFIDQLDNRRKYCQMKSGPSTINKDDVQTIKNHFQAVRRLARTNNLSLEVNDMIVGVVYGMEDELSQNYRTLAEEFPVYIGQNFWHRITGDEAFYQKMIDEFGEVAEDEDVNKILENTINELATYIENQSIRF